MFDNLSFNINITYIDVDDIKRVKVEVMFDAPFWNAKNRPPTFQFYL